MIMISNTNGYEIKNGYREWLDSYIYKFSLILHQTPSGKKDT